MYGTYCSAACMMRSTTFSLFQRLEPGPGRAGAETRRIDDCLTSGPLCNKLVSVGSCPILASGDPAGSMGIWAGAKGKETL